MNEKVARAQASLPGLVLGTFTVGFNYVAQSATGSTLLEFPCDAIIDTSMGQ